MSCNLLLCDSSSFTELISASLFQVSLNEWSDLSLGFIRFLLLFFTADGWFFLPGELPLSLDAFGLYGSLIYLFIWEISNLNWKCVIISLTSEKLINLLHGFPEFCWKNKNNPTKRKSFNPLVAGLLAMKKQVQVFINSGIWDHGIIAWFGLERTLKLI